LKQTRVLGRLWYGEPNDAIEYAKFRSRSHDAVIRVYDEAGNVIETHEQAGVQRLVARLSAFRLNSASYMPNIRHNSR
jgi:hypothetical protein